MRKVHLFFYPSIFRSPFWRIHLPLNRLFSVFLCYIPKYIIKVVSNIFVKFTDDTTVVRLNYNGEETAYRVEVLNLTTWCPLNNLVHLKNKGVGTGLQEEEGGSQRPTSITGVRAKPPASLVSGKSRGWPCYLVIFTSD